ncbi:MAG: chemotaxis protein CheA, partial [Sphingopyxis sp.]
MDDLLNEFIGETLDMMDAVSSDLVAWQADHTERSGLDGIFRAIHTVKGSSGFFALPRITALSHAAEDLLDGLRARRIQPDRATVSTVLAAFDRIGDIVRSTARAGAEPDGDDVALIAALVNAANANGSGTAQPADDAAAMAVHAMAPPTQGTADSATGGTGPAQADLADLAGESGVGADGGTAPGSAVVEKAALPVATAGDVAAEWRSVRVPLKLLDEVMNGVSDLMLARNEVAAQLRRMDMEQGDLPSFGRLSALLGQVRASVSQMRMVPLRHLFAPLPRQVHQLGGELGKSVSLNVMGGEVEIDREVSEALRDPLTHTMRNAIDHGIESAADRLAAGKPAEGRIAISARQAGNRILISVEDDGRGLNLEALARRAIACGHMTHDQLVRLTPADIANFIFMPGLSTAPAVSGISGRGVGMDVVKANVERLGGTVRVENHPGRGAVLTFDVPMTLTIISALAVEAGGQPFAIARSVVDEVMLASSDVIQRVDAGGAAMVRVRGQIYPLLVLEDVLGLPVDGAMAADDRCYVLCRAGATRRLVLDAPEVRDHDELVIKPLPPVLQSLGLYNGLTLPDSGAPMLMLDVEAIANRYALPLPPILAEPAPV